MDDVFARNDAFAKFTGRGRIVIAFANQEAQRLNHEAIGSEHIFLGLVKEPDGLGGYLLREYGVDLALARSTVVKYHPPEATDISTSFSQRQDTKAVIKKATKACKDMKHNYVGTEHLLVGLVSARTEYMPKIFNELQIDPEKLMKKIHLTPECWKPNAD